MLLYLEEPINELHKLVLSLENWNKDIKKSHLTQTELLNVT